MRLNENGFEENVIEEYLFDEQMKKVTQRYMPYIKIFMAMVAVLAVLIAFLYFLGDLTESREGYIFMWCCLY